MTDEIWTSIGIEYPVTRDEIAAVARKMIEVHGKQAPHFMPPILALAFMLILSACASKNEIPPPNPILPSDLVKDATTAAMIANRDCPDIEGDARARLGLLVGDNWLFGYDIPGASMKKVEVRKSDGKIVSCFALEY